MLRILAYLLGLPLFFLISYLIAHLIEQIFHCDLSPDQKHHQNLNSDSDE